MFMRDFAEMLARTGPERSYDTLVQFGHAPITAMVNMQWKREVLERHESERAKRGDRVREGSAREPAKPRERRVSTLRRRNNGVEWKRPVCVRAKLRMSKKRIEAPEKPIDA